LKTADIRELLVAKYLEDPFTPMVEIKGASFVADKPAIIGEPNEEYIRHELDWYESQSLSINDIPGGAPLMWRRTANEDGKVNSNYGWVFWSEENGLQFNHVVGELRRDYASRRALCIYTRPNMHLDQKLGGSGQDFMCTNAVAYSIDPDAGALDVTVQMRSNDVVFGYRNDYAWQKYAAEYVLSALHEDWPRLKLGTIYWQAMSLHVYPRHYGLLREAATIDKWDRTPYLGGVNRDIVREAEGLPPLVIKDGDVS
jgi:thymidylate synthase